MSDIMTDLLYSDKQIDGMDLKPDSFPIFQSTAYTMSDMDEVGEVYGKKERGFTYIRRGNPNRTVLESTITMLEKGEASLCYGSCMSAILSIMIKELKAGDHVVCNSHIYGETKHLLQEVFEKFGVETTYTDFTDVSNVKAAVRENTKVMFSEVLSNPTLRLADVKSIAEIAHSVGAVLVVDNTFTTPLAFTPFTAGADYVVNSLTKYINGHNDASGGSVTASKAKIDALFDTALMCGGLFTSPFDAWLIHRGVQTLAVRMEKQMETACKLADFLEKHNLVDKVYHPSTCGYEQRDLADSMFEKGKYTAILSFVASEDMEKVNQFMKRLKYAQYAPTLGGIRTTLSHPVTSSHASMPDADRRKIGITPGMIRVSVGMENADDLIKDFEQALEAFR